MSKKTIDLNEIVTLHSQGIISKEEAREMLKEKGIIKDVVFAE